MIYRKRDSDTPQFSAARSQGAYRRSAEQRSGMAIAVLLLAAIVAPSLHAQSDDTPRNTNYDADALAGWVQFFELAKIANNYPITDEVLRSRFGQDVKRMDSDSRGYRDWVDYRKADGHGFDIDLSYTTLVHGLKNSGPGAVLNVRLPDKGCLDRNKARADLTAAGFTFFHAQAPASPGPSDNYLKDQGAYVQLFLRTAIRARTTLQEMKYGPRAALVCVASARVTS
jgi:hypothetical protein